ncbi:hypothetical protein AC1031_019434 [Aphanomyces cochlioides]|nr:hypothetical protein AC1031_019434 [Aphanomyces cochlioides]
MIRAMLRLCFSDATILKRFLEADTNTKKDTFWCYFAAVLTNEVGVAVSAKRLRDKYKKVKCEYKAHADDLCRTEWFSGKTGVANEIMFDSNESDYGQRGSADEKRDKAQSRSQSSCTRDGSRNGGYCGGFQMCPTDDLAALLRTSQEENRCVMERMVEMQEKQNALMEQLINAIVHKK